MNLANGTMLADMLIERRRHEASSPRQRIALASAIRAWLAPRGRRQPALPPAARLLASYRDVAERIARGLEEGPVRPEAVRAVEQLLSDVRPRSDDLRRALFLIESR